MSSFVQRKKKLILGIGIPVLVIGIALLAIWLHLDQYHFSYTRVGLNRPIPDEGIDTYIPDAPTIYYPVFQNYSDFTFEKEYLMYYSMNGIIHDYTRSTAREYDYYLELDYDVTKTPDTLTVSFKGLGYPDKGEGEPVPLDKDFVFDISRVNEGIEPQLIDAVQ